MKKNGMAACLLSAALCAAVLTACSGETEGPQQPAAQPDTALEQTESSTGPAEADLDRLSALQNDVSGTVLRLGMTREEVEAVVPRQAQQEEHPGECYGETPEDTVYVTFADGTAAGLMISEDRPAEGRISWSLMGIRQGDSREKVTAVLGEEPFAAVPETEDRAGYWFYCCSVTNRFQKTPDSNTALVLTIRMKDDKVVGFGTERYAGGDLAPDDF